MLRKILGQDNVTTNVHQTFNNFSFNQLKHLTIIDEADRLLFGDDQSSVPNITGKGPLLCLSATGLTQASSHEMLYLSGLMFCVTSNWIDTSREFFIHTIDTFDNFLKETQRHGKIVYATEDDTTNFKSRAEQQGYTVFVNI